MKHLLTLPFVLTLLACSTTKQLEMDPDIDLSALPARAQCWLVDFEQVCIALSADADMTDTGRLKSDVGQAVRLLELLDEKKNDSWYAELSPSESKRLNRLLLAIVVYYGVKHFIDE